MFRLLGFAIVITWFWYFYYKDEKIIAEGMLVTAAWLAAREAGQMLRERAHRPGRPSRLGGRSDSPDDE